MINRKRERTNPGCKELGRIVSTPTKDEQEFLLLKETAKVFRIRRLRPLEGTNSLLEVVTVPASVFPGLMDCEGQLPNTLYDHYQAAFGITIQRASEDLKAIGAPKQVAKAMGLEPGVPILHIQRTAYALDGTPVERRISWLHTDNFAYHNELL